MYIYIYIYIYVTIYIYTYIYITKIKSYLTFWLELSELPFSRGMAISAMKLAAKIQKPMLNHKKSNSNNLNWKYSDLTN